MRTRHVRVIMDGMCAGAMAEAEIVCIGALTRAPHTIAGHNCRRRGMFTKCAKSGPSGKTRWLWLAGESCEGDGGGNNGSGACVAARV